MLGRDKGYYRLLDLKKHGFLEYLESIKEKLININVHNIRA